MTKNRLRQGLVGAATLIALGSCKRGSESREDFKDDKGPFDGTAGVEVPNGDKVRPLSNPGPHYINAGSYFYHLDIVSLTFAQHF